MKRNLLGILLGVMMVVVTTNTALFSEDKVERREKGNDKVVTVGGKITDEGLAGVKIKSGPKETLIPATDIHRVYYEDMPQAIKQAYINLWNKEDAEKDPKVVLGFYQDFQPKMGNAPGAIKRHIDYRIASLLASFADTEAQKEEARKSLAAFVTAHPASWQFPLAAKMLARLQIDRAIPDFDGAAKTLDGIVRSNVIPAELRSDADLMLVDILFQAGKTEEVKAKIAAAIADPKTTEQQKTRFVVYQTAIEAKAPNAKLDEVLKKLEVIVTDNKTENSVKALAYNVIGDCHMAAKLPDSTRHAMWSYLWVDVVYNQDRNEHIKAMNRLLQIFTADNDVEKVQLYKDKIARLK